MGVVWSGEAEGVREDEVGVMLLSGDGDAVGSLRMAMASGRAGVWGGRGRCSPSPEGEASLSTDGPTV